MLKKKELKNVTMVVESILTKHANARDDDWLLYGFYMNNCGWSVHTSFKKVHALIVNHELPSLETVGRIRRKLQEEKPELRGTEDMMRARKKEETAYREYYGGKNK